VGPLSSAASFLLCYFHPFSSVSYVSPSLFVPLVIHITVCFIYPFHTVAQLAEALHQKPEGPGFHSPMVT
jgi:hypothetical protein